MKRLMTKLMSDTDTRLGATRARIRGFRGEEEGGMIIFSLFMMVLILFLAGMAVDLMRFETTRAKLQGTLDRATLAAADLDQTLSPSAVVTDYFTKAGMIQFLDGTVVDEGINYRVVTANASAEMPMFFADIPRVFTDPFSPGLSTMNVSGNSTAEERVTDVEISLVLDVSGSMGRNSRIQNLRPAAKDFVTTVMANNTNAPQGLITISMIPYSAVVNPGTAISSYLNLNETHVYSSCPLFDTSLFNTTELDLNDTYDHVSHFDPDWYSADPEPIGYPWCHVGDHNAIFPVTTNEGELHDRIDALVPYGNTAIDMGVKWGVALLDPSTRSMITQLANNNNDDIHVPAMAAGRPEDLNLSDVLKVIVLMTDGSNTQQYDLQDRFKNGTSFIWFDLDSNTQALHTVPENRISIQYSGQRTPTDFSDDLFYWNGYSSSQRWKTYPNGFASQADYTSQMEDGPAVVVVDPGVGPTYENHVRQAAWQELYANWTYNRVNNELLSRAYNHGAIPYSTGTQWTYGHSGSSYQVHMPDYRDADYAIDYSVVNSTQANSRLSDICQAARDESIIIYTVAFEAPSGGQAALQDCASSPSHYFDVAGTDISAAFSAIASDIRALKLTQ